MSNKRYYTSDTYGAYNQHGLKKFIENHSITCHCPVCTKLSNPFDIYTRSSTNEELKSLTEDLKIHRLHTVHKEMGKASALIDRHKYLDHVNDKRAAAKEVQTILGGYETQTTADDF